MGPEHMTEAMPSDRVGPALTTTLQHSTRGAATPPLPAVAAGLEGDPQHPPTRLIRSSLPHLGPRERAPHNTDALFGDESRASRAAGGERLLAVATLTGHQPLCCYEGRAAVLPRPAALSGTELEIASASWHPVRAEVGFERGSVHRVLAALPSARSRVHVSADHTLGSLLSITVSSAAAIVHVPHAGTDARPVLVAPEPCVLLAHGATDASATCRVHTTADAATFASLGYGAGDRVYATPLPGKGGLWPMRALQGADLDPTAAGVSQWVPKLRRAAAKEEHEAPPGGEQRRDSDSGGGAPAAAASGHLFAQALYEERAPPAAKRRRRGGGGSTGGEPGAGAQGPGRLRGHPTPCDGEEHRASADSRWTTAPEVGTRRVAVARDAAFWVELERLRPHLSTAGAPSVRVCVAAASCVADGLASLDAGAGAGAGAGCWQPPPGGGGEAASGLGPPTEGDVPAGVPLDEVPARLGIVVPRGCAVLVVEARRGSRGIYHHVCAFQPPPETPAYVAAHLCAPTPEKAPEGGARAAGLPPRLLLVAAPRAPWQTATLHLALVPHERIAEGTLAHTVAGERGGVWRGAGGGGADAAPQIAWPASPVRTRRLVVGAMESTVEVSRRVLGECLPSASRTPLSRSVLCALSRRLAVERSSLLGRGVWPPMWDWPAYVDLERPTPMTHLASGHVLPLAVLGDRFFVSVRLSARRADAGGWQDAREVVLSTPTSVAEAATHIRLVVAAQSGADGGGEEAAGEGGDASSQHTATASLRHARRGGVGPWPHPPLALFAEGRRLEPGHAPIRHFFVSEGTVIHAVR